MQIKRAIARALLLAFLVTLACVGLWTSGVFSSKRVSPEPARALVPPLPSPGMGSLPKIHGGSPQATEAARVSAHETTAPESGAPSAPSGSISGTVRDDHGRAYARVTVELHAGRDFLREQPVQPDGRFAFESLDPGTYSVRVSQASLPEGMLAPWRQDQGSWAAEAEYQAKLVTVPAEGGRFEVRLRVFAEAQVIGRMVGPESEPIEHAHVRLQSAAAQGQLSSLMAESFTDGMGRFQIEHVYPGLYRVTAYPRSSSDEQHRTRACMLPIDLEVLPSGWYDLGTLQIGTGDKEIRGRVMNEEGEAFAGLEMVCYPGGLPAEGFGPHGLGTIIGRAITDKEGMYVLRGLPGVEVKVQPGNYMEQPLGKRKAAFWVWPAEVDLRGSETSKTIQDIAVPESRPYAFNGLVRLDPVWAAKNEVDLGSIRVKVELDPDRGASAVPERRPSFSKDAAIDRQTGEFTWMCETPLPPVKLTLSAGRRKGEPIVFEVVPEPNGVRNETIDFPR